MHDRYERVIQSVVIECGAERALRASGRWRETYSVLDWNGKVIAEENASGVPVLYMGHYFPASDIPPQVCPCPIIPFCLIPDIYTAPYLFV